MILSLIKEYHKAWKSGGTCVESLRMQTRDNLERMVVIKAFIVVRVLGLWQKNGKIRNTKSHGKASVSYANARYSLL